jgi:Protein of unknown function (DUF3630)
MKQFDTVEMASGGLALVLEQAIVWEQFPSLSKKWAMQLNAKPIFEPIVSISECVWEVEISGGRFWITYDDFQESIQLEPKEARFNDIVLTLQRGLKK